MQATSPKAIASVKRFLNSNPDHEPTPYARRVVAYLQGHGVTAWARGEVVYAIERGTISFRGCTPEPYCCFVRFETFAEVRNWLGY